MGERPNGKSIDRIDNDGDYCKNNCKWSTYTEQANNTRQNVYIEYHGESKTISQWSKEKDIKYHTLYGRFRKGWDIDVLFKDVRKICH
jgi:hypothetical protein